MRELDMKRAAYEEIDRDFQTTDFQQFSCGEWEGKRTELDGD
jgi:hypothetical protein